jgi:hypothetical protein
MISDDLNSQTKSEKAPDKKPNDVGLVDVSDFVRITDPETKQVVLETRG